MIKKNTVPIKSKTGFASVLVIGFVVVLFIMFGRMMFLMKQEAFMASHFHRRAILSNIAEAGSSCGLNALEVMLNDPKHPLYKELSDPKNLKYKWDLATPIYPSGEYSIPCLDELLAKYPGTKLEVKAVVKYLTKFDPIKNPDNYPGMYDNLKYINKEKIGGLEVVATATLGVQKQVVREGRNLKVTCNVLPVLSRFSLFVQKSFKNGDIQKLSTGKEQYVKNFNLIESDEKGSLKKGKPVILASGKKNYKTNGWIFMGQGDSKDDIKIISNLSGGSSPVVGETHHIQPDIYKNDGSRGGNKVSFGGSYGGWSGATYSKPTDPGDTSYHPTDTAGFFDSGMCSDLNKFQAPLDPLGMGFMYTMNAKKGSTSAPLGSVFKFYGTTNEPDVNMNMPYMMMGNVYRSYVQIGVFQFDKDPAKGWTTTGFFPYLPQNQFATFFDKLDKKVQQIYQQQSQSNSTNTSLTWEQLLHHALTTKMKLDKNSYPLYQKFMSNIVPELFISSAASQIQTEYSRGKLLPKKENDWGSIIPQNAMNMDQDFDKTLNTFFLTKEYFDKRETLHFDGKKAKKDFLKYLKKHIISGKLELGKVVVVDAPSITLPSISDIGRGGMIVCTGDIEVNTIDCQSSTMTPETKALQLLSIVSLGGKIEVKGKKINASLIALGEPKQHPDESKDSLFKTSSKFEIFGNVVCGRVDPENLSRKGGKIKYNTLLSPSKDNKDSYLFNDYAYCINLMPQITYWEVKGE